jgi:hypothetical protein
MMSLVLRAEIVAEHVEPLHQLEDGVPAGLVELVLQEIFAMSGLAPIAAVMLQCHDRSKSANNRLTHPSRSESAEVA